MRIFRSERPYFNFKYFILQNSRQSSTIPSEANVKNTFTSHIDKKIFLTFFWTSLSLYIWYQVRVITVFTVFRLLTDFVCLYNYEFGLSLCKIVRSSVILLLPLSTHKIYVTGRHIYLQIFTPSMRIIFSSRFHHLIYHNYDS
jgi:hypothetical protein